jgi:hypothetical protein
LKASEDNKKMKAVKDNNKYSKNGTKHTFPIPRLQIARIKKYKE